MEHEVADHAHNGQIANREIAYRKEPRGQAQYASDRIASGEEAPRERLVDDQHSRSSSIITIVEIATCTKCDAIGAEEFRRDEIALNDVLGIHPRSRAGRRDDKVALKK